MKIKLGLLLIVVCSLGFVSAQSWSVVERAALPIKISNNAVVEAFPNGQAFVYSFGGIDSTKVYTGISNRSFKYNVATDTWDTIPSLPDPMTKIAAAASYVNGKIYVIGGYTVFANGSEVSSNKIHRFDPVADTFLTDGAVIPIPIDDHVQCVYKDSLIYVVSGWSNTTNVKNVQVYDTYLNTWSQATQVPFNEYRIFGSTGVIVNDTIYYFGGASRFGSFPATNILRKGAIDPANPNQITWSFSIPNASVYSYRNAATTVNNTPVWVGGSSITYNYNGIAYNGSGGVPPSNRVIEYNSATDSLLTSMPSFGNIPMDLRGIASISDTVKYLVGGMESGQQVSNKTLQLTYSVVTAVQNVSLENKVYLSPNPSKDQVSLIMPSVLNGRVRIFNLKGKQVLEKQIFSNQLSLETKTLPSGVYLILIETGRFKFTKKLIVSH